MPAVRIGALTDSWGSTPHMAGLRDGLVALGYREREDFVIGVRFRKASMPVCRPLRTTWCAAAWISSL